MSDYILEKNNYTFNYYQYRKNLTKKNNFSFYLIFFIIILLIGLCIFLYPKPKNFREFHYVEIDNFQTYKEAINLSQSIAQNGGAGYIYFDGIYHVLASFYSSFDDAEKVAENLKNEYSNTQVLTINCKHFNNQKNLLPSQNTSIKNLIETTKKAILQLEDLSINFDTNKTSFNEATIYVKKYHNTFSSCLDEFINNFKTNSKFNKAKEYAQDISKTLSRLYDCDEQNFLINLRYSIVEISITLTQISSFF